MSQDWTREDVLKNPSGASDLIYECLTHAVEMRTKIRELKAEIERLEKQVTDLG